MRILKKNVYKKFKEDVVVFFLIYFYYKLVDNE